MAGSAVRERYVSNCSQCEQWRVTGSFHSGFRKCIFLTSVFLIERITTIGPISRGQ